MAARSNDRLNIIYQLSEDIMESRARAAAIMYNEQKNGLGVESTRHDRIENLRTHIDELTLNRHDELLSHYSGVKVHRKVLSQPTLPPHKKQQIRSPYASPRPAGPHRTRTSKSPRKLL
jgi:hypothetical protein